MIIEFKQPKKSKEGIYLEAIMNQLRENYKVEGMGTPEIIKCITPFLIYLNKYGLDSNFKTVKDHHLMLRIMTILIGRLTPREIMTYYPITKRYDGEKYEWKDYYYTKEYLQGVALDEPIGEEFEKVFTFIWEYQNRHINALTLTLMGNLDKMQEMTGGTTFENFIMNTLQETPTTKLEVIKGGAGQ